MLTRNKAMILGVGVLMFSGQAQATVGKCQAAFDKVGLKLESSVSKGIGKCVAAAQKEVDSDGAVTIASSEACDGAIVKVNAAISKTLGKCLKNSTKCTVEELYQAGHLVSTATGNAAVGDVTDFAVDGAVASHVDFACQWIVNNATQTGIKQLFARVPNAQARIVEAATADTGLTFLNLQVFSSRQPTCATHVCSLNSGASSAFLSSSTLGPVPLGLSGTVAIEVCRPVGGADTATVQTGTMLLSGSVAKGLPPINLFGLATVCARTVKVEGECNCGQTTAGASDITLCRDADSTAGTDCVAGANTVTLSPAGGTDNGPLLADFSGAALPSGGCHGALTVEFALHNGPPVAASCTSSGPATAKLAPSNVLFTTGSVSGTILDTSMGTLTSTGGLTGSPGAGITCGNLEASSLASLKLVGAQPALDGGTTGDAIIGVGLQCQ